MYSQVVTVTPAYAKKLLASNKTNRKISKANCNRILTAMRNGEWKLNGESIVISKNEQLLDGQHRLTALVEYGSPLPMLMVFNADDSVFDTFDQNKLRNGADTLHVEGVQNSKECASILRLVFLNDNKLIGEGFAFQKVSNSQILQTAKAYPRYTEAASLAVQLAKSSVRGSIVWNKSIMGFLLLHNLMNPSEGADVFFEQLSTKIGWSSTSPAYVLDRYFSAVKGAASGRSAVRQQFTLIAATRTYLMARDNQEVSRIIINPGQKFPYLDFNPKGIPEPDEIVWPDCEGE